MSQSPYWKRALASGVRFAQVRSARGVAADLIARTQHAGGQLAGLIGEVVEIARHRNGELGRIVRSGADRQLAGLGLVTKQDLVTFERRMGSGAAAKTAQAMKKDTARRGGMKKPASGSTAKRGR